ncbi:unnamed protein product, partial [Polarella glacialis]
MLAVRPGRRRRRKEKALCIAAVGGCGRLAQWSTTFTIGEPLPPSAQLRQISVPRWRSVLPSRLVGRQAAAGVEYRTRPGLVAAQPAEYRRGSARQRWLRWQPRAGSAGLVTFAVLGLFEWDDGKDDDDETEDDKKSRSGGSSSSPLPR